MIVLSMALACNNAPLDYRDYGTAPWGNVEWGWPSDVPCGAQGQVFQQEVDGFSMCMAAMRVPVDDPVLVPCDPDALDADEHVLYVADGERARAYGLATLGPRELLHDDWGDDPILVDW